MAAVGPLGHSAAISEAGSLFVWGCNDYGQLGTRFWMFDSYQPALTPERVSDLPVEDPVRQVAAGDKQTCIVTDAGDLLVWGCGESGQLGLGDVLNRDRPTLVARALFDGEAVLMVACGEEHTAVLTEVGGVYTFGCGEDGQLGHGDEENQLAPRRLPAACFNDERVVMVAAGIDSTVALSEAGHVFTWGVGEYGQLGHNDEENQLAPRQVEAGRFGGEKVVFVAANSHVVAVMARGRLYTWGSAEFGQLGHGDTADRLVPTLVEEGAFGGSAAVMAACGDEHTLVVTHDGALWACGCGHYGRLGLNNTASRYAFERVGAGLFGGARVVMAAAGGSNSAAVTEDGAFWTWGGGDDCRLGLGHGDEDGDEEDRLVPTLVEGLRGERIGRCRGLPAEHALAFAMGTHGRLGGGGGSAAGGTRRSSRLQGKAASPCYRLKEELVAMIVRLCVDWPAGRAGEEEGVVRLLGGGAGAGRAMRVWPAMPMLAVAAGEV